MSDTLEYLKQHINDTSIPEGWYENEIAELMNDYYTQKINDAPRMGMAVVDGNYTPVNKTTPIDAKMVIVSIIENK